MALLGVDGKRCAWVALLGSLCSVACSSEGGGAGSDRDRSSTSDSGAGAITYPAAAGSGLSSSSGGGTDAASSGNASSGDGASEATTGGRRSDPSGQGGDATGGMPPTNGLTEEAGGGPSRGGGAPTADADATAQGGAPGAATASGAGAGGSPNASGEAGRLPIAQAGAPDGTGGPQGGGGQGGTVGVGASGSAGAASNPIGAAGLGPEGTGGEGSEAEGGHTGGAGTPPEGNGGAGDVISDGQVWKDTSVGLRITYWDIGWMRWTYEIARDELTTEQVTALEHLVLIEPAELQASCDVGYYALDIADADGSTERQTVIHPECWRTPVVTYASFRPFLDTFDCSSDGWEFSDEQSSAGVLTPSPCVYQFSLPPDDDYMPEVRWARLAIPGSGRCVVSLTGAHLQASIYAPDGETLLLTAEAFDGDGVVTELEYDYPDAAEYLLLLEPLATESVRFYYELHCDD